MHQGRVGVDPADAYPEGHILKNRCPWSVLKGYSAELYLTTVHLKLHCARLILCRQLTVGGFGTRSLQGPMHSACRAGQFMNILVCCNESSSKRHLGHLRYGSDGH